MSVPGETKFRTQVLARLKLAIERELSSLNANDDIGKVAWNARNLLELSVWVEHCKKSEENAERFYTDCMRDALDKGLEATSGHPVRQGRQDAIDFIKTAGIPDVDSKFKAVSEVARDLGKQDEFAWKNKLLSKFAHPTALSVMCESQVLLDKFRSGFYGVGQCQGNEALKVIEAFFK